METETNEKRVRRVEDEWVEVPAELGDGSGYVTSPVELRPGCAADTINVRFEPGSPGRDIRLHDLRAGIDLIEDESEETR